MLFLEIKMIVFAPLYEKSIAVCFPIPEEAPVIAII
jgi:hypothetical protein